jgi:hypothetical protein
MALRLFLASGVIILLGLLHFLAGMGSKILIVPIGFLLPLLAIGLWKLCDSEDYLSKEIYFPLILAVSGIFLGGAGRWVFRSSETVLLDFASVLAGMLSSAALVVILRRRAGVVCSICRSPLLSRDFQCPRCEQWICGRPGCWNVNTCRCSDCERIQRPIFPQEETWWKERLGRRTMSGRCSRCQAQGQERDLRQCGLCGWPMCRECWDIENGRCTRCGWTIPNLPEPLRKHPSVQG